MRQFTVTVQETAIKEVNFKYQTKKTDKKPKLVGVDELSTFIQEKIFAVRKFGDENVLHRLSYGFCHKDVAQCNFVNNREITLSNDKNDVARRVNELVQCALSLLNGGCATSFEIAFLMDDGVLNGYDYELLFIIE